ncbi:MAG: saccharopine dehydrogenase C-terminal domain-containing protein [Terriglobales bacterium]
MKLLVVGAGMMGSAAAYDMARSADVELVTLVDKDLRRATDAAARMNKLSRTRKVRALKVNASSSSGIVKVMRSHDAALSAVPYFYNLPLAKAAVQAGCHFADLGGNNDVVRRELALDKQAAKRGVAIAPDCGLSPGMASILGGELIRRVGGKADALEIYVGGLPAEPKRPFNYQLVFSVEGLINEYVEPARILRNGKITLVEPLSEPETFVMTGFPPLDAFHTSGGTATLPETFQGKVGECFEKTLRYQGHFPIIRALYDLGLFSSKERKVGNVKIVPRRLMSDIFKEKFAGDEPDVVIMRVEAHVQDKVSAFTVVDRYDPVTKMTAMMRTTAWPASIVVQMLASSVIAKRGAIRQEVEVPAGRFMEEMKARGINIEFSQYTAAPAAVEPAIAGA